MTTRTSTEPHAFHLFDTAVGRSAIAWGPAGVVGLSLPDLNEVLLRARITRKFPDAVEASPPSEITRAVEAIAALLRGEPGKPEDPRDLSFVTLDMTGLPEFYQRAYAIARTIGPGATLTYGEIATRLGVRDAARAVGQAMGKNPFPIVVPCHRVLAAGGAIGGFSSRGGTPLKRRLLAIEGVIVDAQETLPFVRDEPGR